MRFANQAFTLKQKQPNLSILLFRKGIWVNRQNEILLISKMSRDHLLGVLIWINERIKGAQYQLSMVLKYLEILDELSYRLLCNPDIIGVDITKNSFVIKNSQEKYFFSLKTKREGWFLFLDFYWQEHDPDKKLLTQLIDDRGAQGSEYNMKPFLEKLDD
jgi:hypothetical protein